MWVVKLRKIWFSISAITVIAAIVFTAVWSLNFGIDFTGGTLAELRFLEIERPSISEVTDSLSEFDLGDVSIQLTKDTDMLLRFQFLTEEQKSNVLNKLNETYGEIEELRFDSIGPIIGEELRTKTFYAIIGVLFAIIFYVAYAFRKITKPISSWKYGLLTIVAAFHDVLIPVGVFVILGRFFDVEVNAPFVAALLTIMGYSVNDTIVVFDRVRENLLKTEGTFEQIIGRSINQTFTRSINTTITTLLALIAIYFFGGDTIKDFTGVLIIGIAIGAYSSIFIASPLLIAWEKLRRRT